MSEETDTFSPRLVSIITVNFNQTALTCALLDSIRAQDYQQVEVLVVDNASEENPVALFRAEYPEVTFLRTEQNLGFAGGNNQALPFAKGEYLFFVNNDAEITRGCIAELVRLLEHTPGAGIVSPLICYHPGSNNHAPHAVIQYAGMPLVHPLTGRSNMEGNGQEDRGQYAQAFTTGYAHGAAMMVPRKVLDAVGPMREDYFLYYEEVDWCARMHEKGYSVWVAPQAKVWHKESMSLKTLGATKTYYLTRNRVLFMRRHYGGWRYALFSLFRIFVTLPKQLFLFLLKGEWQNMRAFWKASF